VHPGGARRRPLHPGAADAVEGAAAGPPGLDAAGRRGVRAAPPLYRLPGLPTTDLTATALARTLRTTIHLLPTRLREGPHYRAARARMHSTPVRRLTALP
jgi:hypothetical protein